MPKATNVLRDIAAAMRPLQHGKIDLWEERAAHEAERLAKRAAAAAFAGLNGWKEAPARYELSLLGRGVGAQGDYDYANGDDDLLDHPLWFSSNRRFVAAVGQPSALPFVSRRALP